MSVTKFVNLFGKVKYQPTLDSGERLYLIPSLFGARTAWEAQELADKAPGGLRRKPYLTSKFRANQIARRELRNRRKSEAEVFKENK